MNANELADDAANIHNAVEALEWVQKAVPMLRQQQYEIDCLKILRRQDAQIQKLKRELALQRLSDFTQDVERANNES